MWSKDLKGHLTCGNKLWGPRKRRWEFTRLGGRETNADTQATSKWEVRVDWTRAEMTEVVKSGRISNTCKVELIRYAKGTWAHRTGWWPECRVWEKRGIKDEPQGLGPMSLLNVLYCDAEQWNDRFRGGEGEEIKNLNLGMLCSLSRVYLVSKRQLNPALRGKRGAEGRTWIIVWT